MGISVLVASLLLGKVDLISVQADDADSEVRAALIRELGQDKVVDASALFGYLFESGGPMSMQDFSGFRQPPIDGWPAPLADAWTSGVAYCADIAGPPPWGGPKAHTTALTSAWCCGQRLSAYLWQRYLDFAHPDRVIAVNLTKEGQTMTLRAVAYAPGAAEQEVVEVLVAAAQPAAAIDAAIRRLLAGKEVAEPRTVSRTLFVPLKADPFQGQPISGAVPGAKSCDALPSALKISDNGPVSRSVAARWAATHPGTAAPQSCELAFSEHTEPPRGVLPPNTTVTTAVLRCGKDVVSAEVARDLNRAPLDQASRFLIEKIAQRWCH
jgi:hypothetical protein